LVRTVELPPAHDLHERIHFTVAALTPVAEPFVHFLLGPTAQALLVGAGFLPASGRASGTVHP
jgi:hypothetical protein